MRYKDIVEKLNYIHNDGYFNNHYSPETHGTGTYNQFPFTTIGTCDCPKCVAHALAFGIREHYEEHMITKEIIEELKGIYGMDNIANALKGNEKDFDQILKPTI